MATDKIINESQGNEIIDKLDDIADKIHGINYGVETSSNKVVQMTAYQKSSSSTPGAISTGDTLNEAIGKLEKRTDLNEEVADKANNITAGAGIDITGDGSDGHAKTITNTGVYSVENTTVADTSAVNGDIRIVKKVVNNGVVTETVVYVKPKGISDPAFQSLDTSSSGITTDDVHIPTSKAVQDAIDEALASASIYQGTIAAFNDLPTSTPSVIVRKGWYYRVSTAWSAATGTPAAHVGDIIISEKDSPSKTIDGTNWSLLHNEANTDANVAQAPVSTNSDYEVLFSGTADNTNRTEGTGKDTGLKFNPSSDKLTVAGNVSANGFEGNGIDTNTTGFPAASSLSDNHIPSSKLVKNSLDAKVAGPESSTTDAIALFSDATGKTVKNSGVTIETDTNFSGTSDTKIPTSKSITKNVAKTATLTNYSKTTSKANLAATDTINQAFDKLENRVAANQTNILSIENRLNNIHYAPVYGFRIKKGTESDPTAMVEYLYDAVGMTPTSMNFTTGEFDYGSWGDLWFVKNNKPVALNFDGTEAFELSPTDWWKKADGTTDSGLENESSNYNFMARIPLVYVNRWEDASYNYVAISEQPVNTGFLAQAHTGLNGTINSNIYLPMFKGYIDSCTTAGIINTAGKLRSIGGAWISAGTSVEEETRAANNIAGANSGWQLVAHSQRCLIQDLLTLISKSADAKGKFGYGDISTYNSSDSQDRIGSVKNHPNYGKLKSAYERDNTTKAACAQFKGYNDSIHHVTAFFMQDPWGNRWDRTPGLNRINRAYKTKMIPPYTSNGNSDSTYLTASIQTPSGEGWLKTISSTNQFGNLPEAVGAAETTFFKSYFYTNSNADEKLALVGGSCRNGAGCSPRCVALGDAGSYRGWNVGGSPCFVSP